MKIALVQMSMGKEISENLDKSLKYCDMAENSTLNGRGDSDFKNRHHRSVKSDLKLEQKFDKIKVNRD